MGGLASPGRLTRRTFGDTQPPGQTDQVRPKRCRQFLISPPIGWRAWQPAGSRPMFSARQVIPMPGIDETRTFVPLKIAVLTVSDTRSLAEDKSGATLAERIEKAGHT